MAEQRRVERDAERAARGEIRARKPVSSLFTAAFTAV